MSSRCRLSAVPGADARRPSPDPRVRAAARVLGGDAVEEVARDAGVDAGQVLRWADALAAGGEGAVGGLGLERPAVGPTASRVPVEDFLGVVAHELRTPLTAARVALTVLTRPDVAPELRDRVGATVLDRLGALDRLTRDVLDAVSLATGRARLAPERVALDAVVDTACAHAGVALAPGPAVHVWGDPLRLQTVVETLLAHARRYAASERVDVRVQALPDAALLTVRLDGVEADREAAARLFEPFGAAASGDGNGLAMYVVRALVVASGGSVGLAGAPRATVLWVRLPLLDVAAPVPPAPARPTVLPSPREEHP